MIDINIKGLLYFIRVVSFGMVFRKFGYIINVGLVVGKEVYKEGNVYCVIKFVVEGLIKVIWMDFFEYNIWVS